LPNFQFYYFLVTPNLTLHIMILINSAREMLKCAKANKTTFPNAFGIYRFFSQYSIFRMSRVAAIFGLLIASLNVVNGQSDTTYWKKGAQTSLTFSQTSFTNWVGGGTNAVAFNAYLGLFANYKKGKTTWENSIDLGYGLVDQEGTGFRKSDDRINLTSKYGRKIKKTLYWSAMIDFRTQFAEGFTFSEDGSSERISDFMAPAYILLSSGLEWKPAAADYFYVFYSPATGKFTIVNNGALADAGAFGVDPARFNDTGMKLEDGKRFRSEIGTFLKLRFKKDVAKNVNFDSKLELFTGYDDSFGNVDVNWENILLMKVNSWLSVNFISQLLYDDDIDTIEIDETTKDEKNLGPKVQFKQIFGVGVAFSVGDKKAKK